MLRYSAVLLLSVLAACGRDAPTGPGAHAASAPTATVSPAGSESTSAAVLKTLADVRRATAAFQVPAAAKAAGYHAEEHCISAASLGLPAELGAMGVHYVNPALLDGTIEVTAPEVLVYEPDGEGALHLVAVEYLFVGDDPPLFAGEVGFHPFAPPFADFALHAWVWKGNPSGTFTDFNPKVDCPVD